MARKLNRAATLWNSFSSFSRERIILLFDFFRKLAPFCLSARIADLTCVKAAHIIGSSSGHTPSVGQSQNLQGARSMLLVWLVLHSPLSHCQCSSQETDCPRIVTIRGSRLRLCSDSVYAFAPSRRPTMKNRHGAPGCRSDSLHERNATERPRLGQNLPASKAWA